MRDDEIIESRGSVPRRGYDATALVRRPFVFLVAGALLGISFTPAPRPVPRFVVTVSSPSPSPSASETPEPSPSSEPTFQSQGKPVVRVQRLNGRGPFVVFGFGNANATSTLYAFDVSEPEPRTPLELGTVPGDVSNNVIPQLGVSTLAFMTRSEPQTVWLVSRGRQALRRVLASKETVTTAAMSPDGAEIVTLRAVSEASPDATMWLTSTAIGSSRRVAVLKSVRNPTDPIEDLTIRSWDAKTGRMLGVRECHCDGGMGYSTLYTLTRTGKLATYSLKGDLQEMAVASDGASFVYTDLHGADCFVVNCATVERTLRLVSMRDDSRRDVAHASHTTFLNPKLSPDRSLVAYSTGSSIEVLRVSDGRLVGAVDGYADPLAWLDNRRLVTISGLNDPGDGFPGVGMVALGRTLRALPATEGIVDGSAGLVYVGWLR